MSCIIYSLEKKRTSAIFTRISRRETGMTEHVDISLQRTNFDESARSITPPLYTHLRTMENIAQCIYSLVPRCFDYMSQGLGARSTPRYFLRIEHWQITTEKTRVFFLKKKKDWNAMRAVSGAMRCGGARGSSARRTLSAPIPRKLAQVRLY